MLLALVQPQLFSVVTGLAESDSTAQQPSDSTQIKVAQRDSSQSLVIDSSMTLSRPVDSPNVQEFPIVEISNPQPANPESLKTSVRRLTESGVKVSAVPGGSKDSLAEVELKKMVQIFESMETESAARILSNMDEYAMRQVLTTMKRRQSAKILATLEAKVAARILNGKVNP